MDDKSFWTEIRRAALILIQAIEKRYNLGNRSEPKGTTDRRS